MCFVDMSTNILSSYTKKNKNNYYLGDMMTVDFDYCK